MFVDYEILIAWGSVAKKYKKGEYIFHEGDLPKFFFQVIEGSVKIFNTNNEGREFTQGAFNVGDSFGEPLLFIDELYPSNAITLEDSVIIKLSKDKFFAILDEYPNLQKKLIHVFAERIWNKSTTSRDIINTNPESRIISFLKAYKKKIKKEGEDIEIPIHVNK